MHKVLILLFSLHALNASSQPPGNNIDSLITSHIKTRINANKNDTIITFQISFPAMMVPMAYDQKLTGVGVLRVFSVYYMMYEQAGKSYLIKYVDGLDSSCSNTYLAFSNPLLIASDKNVKLVKKLAPKFSDEMIFPPIVKSPGKDYYFVGSTNHIYRYGIGLHTADNNQQIALDENDINKEYCRLCKPPLINLNYSHNVKTNIYKVFLILKPLLEKLDSRFEFERTNLLPAN